METRVDSGQLDHKFVGEICGEFFVPRYQRGYRWDEDDVRRLLDDIWEANGNPYSLQTVVVKLKNKGSTDKEHVWELIDGQQRLTTLYLIMFYMKIREWKRHGAQYSLNYQTRPKFESFLEGLNLEETYPDSDFENIDYFHLYKAFKCIDEWFRGEHTEEKQEYIAGKFHSYLYESVKVIWYRTSDNLESSTELFTRLNVGKIYLTDAELIKALLLSGIRNNPEQTPPGRVDEIAAQWDGIERDLHNPDIWAFVSGSSPDIAEDRYPTRISLLLDTWADIVSGYKGEGKRPKYFTFDILRTCMEAENSYEEFWKQILWLHALVLGWYSKPDLHNRIGFLVTTGTSLLDLVIEARGGSGKEIPQNALTKKEFEASLKGRIRDKLKICKSDLLELHYNKAGDYRKLSDILLLMNVETSTRAQQHFPFRNHTGKHWSLEHIHAQNAEDFKTVAQWRSWLTSHREILDAKGTHQPLVKEIDDALVEMEKSKNFRPVFLNISKKVIDAFSEQNDSSETSGHNLHNVSNLALLSSRDNSALNNAVFELKRQIVLEIDRNVEGKPGNYIPVCTRNVFLKYYPGADTRQMDFWSLKDRQSYYDEIVSVLDNGYLVTEELVS